MEEVLLSLIIHFFMNSTLVPLFKVLLIPVYDEMALTYYKSTCMYLRYSAKVILVPVHVFILSPELCHVSLIELFYLYGMFTNLNALVTVYE